jgi:hypothetical protein
MGWGDFMFIAHTYYTSGMHELAKICIKSFAHYHEKYEIPLYVDVINPTEEQVKELIFLYKYISVTVFNYPINKLAIENNVSAEKLYKWKKEVERGYVTNSNRFWKLLIAGDKRVKRVEDIIKSISDNTLIVHFDIDTLFRNNIMSIISTMRYHEAGLKIRPTTGTIKSRITIDFIALKVCRNVKAFIKYWIDTIDKTKLTQRPIGFGQISCWHAYNEAVKKNNLKSIILPLEYGLPGQNLSSNYIWCGNIHKLKKNKCAIMFNNEFNRLTGVS